MNIFNTVLVVRRGDATTSSLVWSLHAASFTLLFIQLWLMVKRPHAWTSIRTKIIWTVRLLRMLIVYSAYADPEWVQRLATLDAQPNNNRSSLSLFTSLAVVGLFSGLNFPLPFCQQATLATMLGALGVFVGAKQTNCAVRHPLSDAAFGAQSICNATVGIILSLSLLASPAALQPDPLGLCQLDNSGLSASLFFTLYLGCLTPLHVTYWYERRIKAAYLNHLSRGRNLVVTPPSLLQQVMHLIASAPLCCIAIRGLTMLGIFDTSHCGWSKAVNAP